MHSLFHPNPDSSVTIRFDKRNTFSLAAIQAILTSRGIKATFSSNPCDGVMIYSMATPQAREVYREVENAQTRSVFIAGGPHPSAKASEALEQFDVVVLGEGEETLPELICALKDDSDLETVRGIAYKRAGIIYKTHSRPHVLLDDYPPFNQNLRAPIEITRGCPHNCKYCQTPRLFGKKMRHRSVRSIAFYSNYLSDVRFISPNAFAYGSDGRRIAPERVSKLLASLCGRVYFGTFPSEVRPEFITDEMLDVVKEYCVNTSIHIGAQSGSDAVLEETNRGHSRRDVEAAVEICLNHGFSPVVDFIFGLPTEEAADQADSLDLIDSIVSAGGKVRAHYFIPLPGTPYENETPAPVGKEVQKRLGRLARDGKLTGRWEPS
ncbi:MAG: TIGR04013 family B12-binding domain/radical SAM domain-containing protein [Euryarchaeota archaeon]|nr:TIGR04013 family B12-binding domain/radical SAM domain-containing protein [Euryarchaeota archaeon]